MINMFSLDVVRIVYETYTVFTLLFRTFYMLKYCLRFAGTVVLISTERRDIVPANHKYRCNKRKSNVCVLYSLFLQMTLTKIIVCE